MIKKKHLNILLQNNSEESEIVGLSVQLLHQQSAGRLQYYKYYTNIWFGEGRVGGGGGDAEIQY